MKNVILAEPSTLVLLGLGFFLLIFLVVAVLGAVAVWVVFLTRKAKKEEPPVSKLTASTQIIPKNCPKCGTAMPSDSPEGLCPRCLMALNLATQTEIPGEPGTAKAPPGPPAPVADVAKLFPQLEILECLGRGGMGAVYKARQPRLDRVVALKILSPEKQGNQKFSDRFEREARALAKLHHPNIVTVYDFGEVEGNFYLLMEFVDGLTLRQLLQSRKLAPSEALAIVPEICEALQYAHEQGIVHRDIKPENILMDKDGRVKIADFGIAKILGDNGSANLTAEQVIGTPHYMSPEQIEKPQSVDHRADIYSLGVVFYEMLTGELPLGKFPPPSKKVQVDVRLDEIVLRALEKEPERRYQQASEVKTRVENIAASPHYAGASAQPVEKPDHFWRRFAVVVLAIFSIPFLIALVGILAAIAIPNFVKGRQHALALRQQELVTSQYQIGTSLFYLGNSWFPEGDSIEITSVEQNGKQIIVKGHYTLLSHQDALLKLDVTFDGISGVPDEPSQSTHINRGSGDFVLAMTSSIPGLPHVSMYADGRSFAALYFGKKDDVAEEKKLYDSMMSDPVALWLADGNADDSAHGHNGVLENAGFTNGVIGSAFAFHPENHPFWSGVTIPDDPAFAVTSAFSIEGWIQPTDPGYLIFWRGDRRPGTDPYFISMDDTRLKFAICDEANNVALITTPISYHQWWHFAAVFDNGTMTLYTNGVMAVETNTTIRPFATLMASEHPGLGIGNLNDGGNSFPFRGNIDDLAFYRRALSPLEVRFNYEIGFKTRADSPPSTLPETRSPALMTSQIADLQRIISETQDQLVQRQAQLAQLSAMNGQQLRQALPDIVKDSELSRLQQKLDDAQLQLAAMTNRLSRTNPEVLAQNTQIDIINRQINERMTGIMMSLKAQIDAQQTALTNLEKKLPGNNLENSSPLAHVPAPASTLGSRINPATGLPDDGNAPPSIDPYTGLPENGSGPQKIDPATGLPQSDLYDEWQQAKKLMNQGQYEDSLQAFTNYFEQSRFDQGQAGARLFSLIDWAELGRRYPEAKQALLDLRDTDTEKLLNGDGDFGLFGEVQCINQDLGHTEATYRLFKAIEQRDPQLAGQCYPYVEDQLVQHGEYQTCRKYMGDPESGFQSDCDRYRMEMENNTRMEKIHQQMVQHIQEVNREHPNAPPFTPPDNSQRMEKMIKDHFVGQVRQTIEILVATGDKANAETIQREAVAILNDPRLRSAMEDAEKEIRKQGEHSLENETANASTLVNTNHPHVIWVSPSDGAANVDPQQDVRIRFDQPMNPNDMGIIWSSGGFFSPGQFKYDPARNEFDIPLRLVPGKTHKLGAGWGGMGFRNTNSISADQFEWQFTTKPFVPKPGAAKPAVIQISPKPGEVLSVLTLLEITFDQPMTLDHGFPWLRDRGSSFNLPGIVPDLVFDPSGRRLTIPLILPPDNETKLSLEGFYNTAGLASDPVVVRCEIGTNNYSGQQLKYFSVAAKDLKLNQLLSSMQAARARLASGTETVKWTLLGQERGAFNGITASSATFKWQGTNQFYEDISGIMGTTAFILGSDGETCWMYSDDRYIGRRLMSSPAASVADFYASVADPFDLAHHSVQSAIEKGKLVYEGQTQLDGRPCYQITGWQVAQTGDDYFPVSAVQTKWWIDSETYLPAQVVQHRSGQEAYLFRYEGLNQSLPAADFQPPVRQGTKSQDWFDKKLETNEVLFLKMKDGSDGQMSGRIGRRGPNGSENSGLN